MLLKKCLCTFVYEIYQTNGVLLTAVPLAASWVAAHSSYLF